MSIFAADKERRAAVAGRLSGKKTKEEANYRPHDNADSKDSCFDCQSYLDVGKPQSACSKVAGIMSAEDTCDLWSERTSQPVGQAPAINISVQVTKGQ